MALIYRKGDATDPQAPEGQSKLILHCVNDIGRFGAGFALALANRWSLSKVSYEAWYRSLAEIPGYISGRMGLGEIQVVQVEDDIWVGHIVGQHGIGIQAGGRPPVRYEALQSGLSKAYRQACVLEASVHLPRLGAGLAGGHWGNIEAILKKEIADKGIDVTVYDL